MVHGQLEGYPWSHGITSRAFVALNKEPKSRDGGSISGRSRALMSEVVARLARPCPLPPNCPAKAGACRRPWRARRAWRLRLRHSRRHQASSRCGRSTPRGQRLEEGRRCCRVRGNSAEDRLGPILETCRAGGEAQRLGIVATIDACLDLAEQRAGHQERRPAAGDPSVVGSAATARLAGAVAARPVNSAAAAPSASMEVRIESLPWPKETRLGPSPAIRNGRATSSIMDVVAPENGPEIAYRAGRGRR